MTTVIINEYYHSSSYSKDSLVLLQIAFYLEIIKNPRCLLTSGVSHAVTIFSLIRPII